MFVNSSDVIAALITPPGRGGVGIVRLSGNNLEPFFKGLLGFTPSPRFAHYQPFFAADGKPIDRGITLYFPAPDSYSMYSSFRVTVARLLWTAYCVAL